MKSSTLLLAGGLLGVAYLLSRKSSTSTSQTTLASSFDVAPSISLPAASSIVVPGAVQSLATTPAANITADLGKMAYWQSTGVTPIVVAAQFIRGAPGAPQGVWLVTYADGSQSNIFPGEVDVLKRLRIL